ncbi:hypothetical protein SY83_04570 [Paenibacillus swuensis]|uniref:DUF5808 domain-containing protein n=1 Tax=Paenibacillus swuensis TaxID=1178515 RepID=A0A172TFY1_9BACL|nr:DUF5808 domain-containing protein [Paenibacillus swuensis]ANE45693.1 hypothetical protein SY83_04570 [Paenibacillus swuensis]
MSLIVILILCIIYIPTVVLLSFTPYLTRKTESFGVSVTEEIYHSPELRRMRKRYAWTNGLGSMLIPGSLILFHTLLSLSETGQMILLLVHIFALTLFSFLLYTWFHRRMRVLKTAQNWMDPKLQRIVVNMNRKTPRSRLSALWYIPHILVVAATVATGLLFYDDFPAKLVMKLDLNGQPLRIEDKSYRNILFPAAVQSFILIMHILIHYSITRAKQQIDPADPETSHMRSVLFRNIMERYMFIIGFLLVSLFYFVQLNFLFTWDHTIVISVSLGIVGIILIYSIWLSFTTGQGGSRIKLPRDGEQTGNIQVDDDRFWKLGVLYYNPEDPSLFVEKRFGVGWTVNNARPAVWVVSAVIVAIPILLAVWLV